MAGASFDKRVVVGGTASEGGLHMHGTPMLNVHGLQAAAISDATAAAGNPPTKTEFDALVTKFNLLLAAARGVGLIASA
jgi:hypothetical protein